MKRLDDDFVGAHGRLLAALGVPTTDWAAEFDLLTTIEDAVVIRATGGFDD